MLLKFGLVTKMISAGDVDEPGTGIVELVSYEVDTSGKVKGSLTDTHVDVQNEHGRAFHEGDHVTIDQSSDGIYKVRYPRK